MKCGVAAGEVWRHNFNVPELAHRFTTSSITVEKLYVIFFSLLSFVRSFFAIFSLSHASRSAIRMPEGARVSDL